MAQTMAEEMALTNGSTWIKRRKGISLCEAKMMHRGARPDGKKAPGKAALHDAIRSQQSGP
jgi:hypothetical protein